MCMLPVVLSDNVWALKWSKKCSRVAFCVGDTAVERAVAV